MRTTRHVQPINKSRLSSELYKRGRLLRTTRLCRSTVAKGLDLPISSFPRSGNTSATKEGSSSEGLRLLEDAISTCLLARGDDLFRFLARQPLLPTDLRATASSLRTGGSHREGSKFAAPRAEAPRVLLNV